MLAKHALPSWYFEDRGCVPFALFLAQGLSKIVRHRMPGPLTAPRAQSDLNDVALAG